MTTLDSGRARPTATRPGSGRAALVAGLLTVGSFVPFGWFVGVILLWGSRLWTVKEKLLGTLLVPGGLGALALVALLMPAQTCVDGVCTGVGDSIPLPVTRAAVVIAAVASVAVPVWLYRRGLRRALPAA